MYSDSTKIDFEFWVEILFGCLKLKIMGLKKFAVSMYDCNHLKRINN